MEKLKIAEIKVSYSTNKRPKTSITGSDSAHKLLLSCWDKSIIEFQEEFKVLLLNRSNKVLGVYPLSKGGVSGTFVDPKLVFSVALKCNASALIFAHNHPSGNLSPSENDKGLTKKLISAGRFLDMKVLDHLIITTEGYYSFADEGIM